MMGTCGVDEAFAHEHRGAPSPYETLPHFLPGLATHLTGSVSSTYALGDFLLQPVILVLIVVFVRRLTGSKAVGIMAGAGALFGYQVNRYSGSKRRQGVSDEITARGCGLPS